MSNNELRHWKYVDKYKKNGEWVYVYPGDKAKKNIFGKVKGGTGGNLGVHKYMNLASTNRINAYSPSRNVPNNVLVTTNDKKMTEGQRDKAKYMGEMARTLGATPNTYSYHRYKLNKSKLNNELNLDRTSSNTREYQEYVAKYPNGTHYDRKPSNTLTKKTIRKAVRKARVKTLKSKMSKSINRAKSWLDGLFD